VINPCLKSCMNNQRLRDSMSPQTCRTGFQDGFRRDVSTIYELFTDAKGYMTHAEPVYQWRCVPLHRCWLITS
jgi:hypothetical protein